MKNLEVCRRCEFYTSFKDTDLNEWQSICHKDDCDHGFNEPFEEGQYAQWPVPKECPYILEHTVTDEDSTD